MSNAWVILCDNGWLVLLKEISVQCTHNVGLVVR
jgi:hypothetical protein